MACPRFSLKSLTVNSAAAMDFTIIAGCTEEKAGVIRDPFGPSHCETQTGAKVQRIEER